MKRFLPAVALMLGLAASFVLPPASHAMGYVPQDVSWRLSRDSDNKGGTRGFIDSTYVCHAATTQRADTTVEISTAGWRTPPSVGTATTTDSAFYFQFQLFPAIVSGVTAGGDSVYVECQISLDGTNWTDVTPTRVFLPAGLLSAGNMVAVLEQSSQDYFFVTYKASSVGANFMAPLTLSSATKPTMVQMQGWPLVRFIVQGDYTGCYRARVVAFKD